jgi:hypothetical protein
MSFVGSKCKEIQQRALKVAPHGGWRSNSRNALTARYRVGVGMSASQLIKDG